MVKATSILMAGITFTGGLLLGFILHLPGASSPSTSRHPRSLSEPGDPSGSVLINKYQPEVGGAVIETDDVNPMQGAPVISSSRSLLYLSINQPHGDNYMRPENDSRQVYLDNDSGNRPEGISGDSRDVKRHFNVQSKRGDDNSPRGMAVEGSKSRGKGYTSSRQGNLNSQQRVNSSNIQRPSAYKRVPAVSKYYNSRNSNNKPSAVRITDYGQNKPSNSNNNTGEHKVKDIDVIRERSRPSESVEEKTFVNVQSTNVGQHKEQRGPSIEPQGKHTLNSDIHDEHVEAVEGDKSVKLSVTVIDIAPGHQQKSGLSDTTLGSSRPPKDIITQGDDSPSLVFNVESNSQRVNSDQNNQHMDTNGSSSVRFGSQLVDLVNGIYWSPQLEDLTPKGFGDMQTTKWRHQASNGRVKELREGCGRMQNRLVVFQDGSKMCARYRINTDQIQGEVYSYYLAQVLGIQNVPPAILAKANPSSPQWGGVLSDIDSAQWSPQKFLVLTPWLGNLQPVYIPKELQSEKPELTSFSESLVNRNLDELTELVQWSDLIVLDYLTGNVDRLVNNMFNKQWNPSMMSAPTHNLERVGQAGPIVFLDNESGLLHSYRLLDKYSEYHEKLLRGLCVFRESTVQHIKRLYQSGTVVQELRDRFKGQEDSFSRGLSFLPHHNLSVLNQRLAQVYRQILSCERRYANTPNT